jgi:hypothetical protein
MSDKVQMVPNPPTPNHKLGSKAFSSWLAYSLSEVPILSIGMNREAEQQLVL